MKNTNTTSYLLLLTFTCFTFIPNNTFAMKRTCATTTQDTFALASDSTHSIETEDNEAKQILSSWPKDIAGKIVTTILDLYVYELETAMDEYDENIRPTADGWGNHYYGIFPYRKYGKDILDKIIHWVAYRSFLPTLNLNNQSIKGNTLLHHATDATIKAHNYLKREQNYSLKYPLKQYYRKTVSDLTHYLLAHNADPNVQNNEGFAVLYSCIKNFDCREKSKKTYINKLIDLLLDNGANPNICSPHNDFLFLLAMHDDCSSPIFQRIIEHTNLKDFKDCQSPFRSGFTLGVWATIHHNKKFLDILSDHRVDLSIKDPAGKSALDYMNDEEWQFWVDFKNGKIDHLFTKKT